MRRKGDPVRDAWKQVGHHQSIMDKSREERIRKWETVDKAPLASVAQAREMARKVLTEEKETETREFNEQRTAWNDRRAIQRSNGGADIGPFDESGFWRKVAYLEGELANCVQELDEAKQNLHFPKIKGFPFRAGTEGVYLGMEDFWLEEVSGDVMYEVTPKRGEMAPKATMRLVGAGGKDGMFFKGRAIGLGLKGEKGTRVPNLSVDELSVGVELVVVVPLHFSTASGTWKPGEDFRIEVLKLERHQSGSLKLPRSVLRFMVNWIVPDIVKKLVVENVPPEVGRMLCTSRQHLKLRAVLGLRSLSIACLDAKLDEARGNAFYRRPGDLDDPWSDSGEGYKADEDSGGEGGEEAKGAEAGGGGHVGRGAAGRGKRRATVLAVSTPRDATPAQLAAHAAAWVGLSSDQARAFMAAQMAGAHAKKVTDKAIPIRSLTDLLRYARRYSSSDLHWPVFESAWQQTLTQWTNANKAVVSGVTAANPRAVGVVVDDQVLRLDEPLSFHRIVEAANRLAQMPMRMRFEVQEVDCRLEIEHSLLMVRDVYERLIRQQQEHTAEAFHQAASSKKKRAKAATASAGPGAGSGVVRADSGTEFPRHSDSTRSEPEQRTPSLAPTSAATAASAARRTTVAPTPALGKARRVRGSFDGDMNWIPAPPLADTGPASAPATPTTAAAASARAPRASAILRSFGAGDGSEAADAVGAAALAAVESSEVKPPTSLDMQMAELQEWYTDLLSHIGTIQTALGRLSVSVDGGLEGGADGNLGLRLHHVQAEGTPGLTVPIPLYSTFVPPTAYSMDLTVNEDGTFNTDILVPKAVFASRRASSLAQRSRSVSVASGSVGSGGNPAEALMQARSSVVAASAGAGAAVAARAARRAGAVAAGRSSVMSIPEDGEAEDAPPPPPPPAADDLSDEEVTQRQDYERDNGPLDVLTTISMKRAWIGVRMRVDPASLSWAKASGFGEPPEIDVLSIDFSKTDDDDELPSLPRVAGSGVDAPAVAPAPPAPRSFTIALGTVPMARLCLDAQSIEVKGTLDVLMDQMRALLAGISKAGGGGGTGPGTPGSGSGTPPGAAMAAGASASAPASASGARRGSKGSAEDKAGSGLKGFEMLSATVTKYLSSKDLHLSFLMSVDTNVEGPTAAAMSAVAGGPRASRGHVVVAQPQLVVALTSQRVWKPSLADSAGGRTAHSVGSGRSSKVSFSNAAQRGPFESLAEGSAELDDSDDDSVGGDALRRMAAAADSATASAAASASTPGRAARASPTSDVRSTGGGGGGADSSGGEDGSAANAFRLGFVFSVFELLGDIDAIVSAFTKVD